MFQYCVDPYSADTVLYLRAIQGHSGGNILILHCKTTCCYRATSPSTSTTLEVPTIFTLSFNQDWSRVGEMSGKGGMRCSSKPWIQCSSINTEKGITTWRSPELQCPNKVGKIHKPLRSGVPERFQVRGRLWIPQTTWFWRKVESTPTRSTLHSSWSSRHPAVRSELPSRGMAPPGFCWMAQRTITSRRTWSTDSLQRTFCAVPLRQTEGTHQRCYERPFALFATTWPFAASSDLTLPTTEQRACLHQVTWWRSCL